MKRKTGSISTISRLFFVLKNAKGMLLVYSIAMMVAALGLAALAVDLSAVMVVSTELKSIADSGALTAAASFLTEMRAAAKAGQNLSDLTVIKKIRKRTQDTTEAVMAKSKVLSNNPDMTISLQFGTFDLTNTNPYHEKPGHPHNLLFTDRTADLLGGGIGLHDITAFRVHVTRMGGGAVQTFFGNICGVASLSFSRNSVSSLSPRNFALVIDNSGSMDDISYPRTTTMDGTGKITAPNPVWPQTESFISRPTFSTSFPMLFSPLAPAPNPPLYPQPLQVVLNSSLDFLEGLIAESDLGDMAGVYYFASHVTQKLSGPALIPVTEDNINNVFTPLFNNSELYHNLIRADPITLPDATVVTNPVYKYNGTAAYDPAIEQFLGPIAIPHGNTNIGDAILTAAGGITSSATSSRSISVIIVFTDGLPNCAPKTPGGAVECFGSEATAAELALARNYTLAQATKAIEQNIRVYPITFGDLGGSTQQQKTTKLLFDLIAQYSGLEEHYHIKDTNNIAKIQAALQKIFDEISLFVPFSLVG